MCVSGPTQPPVLREGIGRQTGRPTPRRGIESFEFSAGVQLVRNVLTPGAGGSLEGFVVVDSGALSSLPSFVNAGNSCTFFRARRPKQTHLG
jgi:hypothetical protein